MVSVEKVDSCGYEGDSVEERDKYLDTIDDGFFDIIVDDGLHKSQHQIATYYNFISKLKPNGMYIIEDIKNWDNHLQNLEEFFGDKIEITKFPIRQHDDNILQDCLFLLILATTPKFRLMTRHLQNKSRVYIQRVF